MESDGSALKVKFPKACGHAVAKAVILPGESLSEPVDVLFGAIGGLYIPEEFTLAPVTLVAGWCGHDGIVVWADLVTPRGTELTTEAIAGPKIVLFNRAANFDPVRFLRVRSGTAAKKIPQVNGAVLQLLLRDAPQSGPYSPPSPHG